MTMLNNHPIFNSSEFFIQTPMVNRLLDQLHGWIWNGLTGGVILGNVRIGKTRAIRYVSDKLVNRIDQPIKAHRLTIPKRDTSSVASIFKNLCYSFDITPKCRATADMMSNDLVHCFGEMALSNKTRQIVLFVDEMQRLKPHQLEAFAELYDNLSEFKINFSVFFIGNYTDSAQLINQVIQSKNGLIRGRFFTHHFIFHGLQNRQDIKNCLAEYDADDKKGKSVTECFLPDAYKQGWRLELISDLIWDVYQENYKRSLKIESWPMQYFTSMIKTLIVDYLPRYGVDDDQATMEMITESIEVSGLVPNLVKLPQC